MLLAGVAVGGAAQHAGQLGDPLLVDQLGFEPSVDLRAGIELTLDHYAAGNLTSEPAGSAPDRR